MVSWAAGGEGGKAREPWMKQAPGSILEAESSGTTGHVDPVVLWKER